MRTAPETWCDECLLVEGLEMGRVWQIVGLGLLALAAFPVSYLIFRDTAPTGSAQNTHDEQPPLPTFQGWTRNPDLAIVISGQMKGYLQPCGCSHPQLGGMARRYQLIESLKSKGWPVAAVDLGDIAQESGPQRQLKYEYSMKALKLMDYQAIGIGKNELLMPLAEALAHYSVNDPQPRPVFVNLGGTDKDELYHDLNVRKYEVFKTAGFNVGVLGAIGESTAREVMNALPPNQKEIKFLPKQAPRVLTELGQHKVDIGILLFQGTEMEAVKCADDLHQNQVRESAWAPIQIVVCSTREEEPPSVPVKGPKFPNTSIVSIGHKGRYVGVVGVWKAGTGLEFKYQLVSIGPELDGKKGANPVKALMEKYTEQVRDQNMVARFMAGPHPHQILFKENNKNADPFYAGSEACIKCHKVAHAIWKDSPHAHAFATLEKAADPKLRHFDGECLACHTVGFQYLTGYNDPPKGAGQKERAEHRRGLRDVGCESCHGPSGEHASNSKDKSLYPIINPFSVRANPKLPESVRLQRIDDFCQKCHDSENDVHWGKVKFEEKWNKIIHMTPTSNQAAQAK